MYQKVDQWVKERWGWFMQLPWYHKLWGWGILILVLGALILLAFLFAGNPEKALEKKKEDVVEDMVEGQIEKNEEKDKKLAAKIKENNNTLDEADKQISYINAEAETTKNRILDAKSFKEVRDAVNEEDE